MALTHPDNIGPLARQCLLPRHKTAEEQPKEQDKEHKASTWPQNPNLIELQGICMKNPEALLAVGGPLCLIQCLGVNIRV